jgi:membrane associated rhomboid family serine protease
MIPLHDDNPSSTRPLVSVMFLVLCVLVFLWQLSLGGVAGRGAVYAFGVIPAVLLGRTDLPAEMSFVPPLLTLLTSMFMHGGWLHLLGNMLYLWIFADNVEDSMGHGRFIVFYLLCGVAAAFAQALPDPSSMTPMVGASGAISGVLGAYLLLYPHARVLTLIPLGIWFPMVRVPAGILLAIWFGLQLFSSWWAQNHAASPVGVAFGAHIGGFLAGMVLVPFMKHSRVRLWAPPR